MPNLNQLCTSELQTPANEANGLCEINPDITTEAEVVNAVLGQICNRTELIATPDPNQLRVPIGMANGAFIDGGPARLRSGAAQGDTTTKWYNIDAPRGTPAEYEVPYDFENGESANGAGLTSLVRVDGTNIVITNDLSFGWTNDLTGNPAVNKPAHGTPTMGFWPGYPRWVNGTLSKESGQQAALYNEEPIDGGQSGIANFNTNNLEEPTVSFTEFNEVDPDSSATGVDIKDRNGEVTGTVIIREEHGVNILYAFQKYLDINGNIGLKPIRINSLPELVNIGCIDSNIENVTFAQFISVVTASKPMNNGSVVTRNGTVYSLELRDTSEPEQTPEADSGVVTPPADTGPQESDMEADAGPQESDMEADAGPQESDMSGTPDMPQMPMPDMATLPDARRMEVPFTIQDRGPVKPTNDADTPTEELTVNPTEGAGCGSEAAPRRSNGETVWTAEGTSSTEQPQKGCNTTPTEAPQDLPGLTSLTLAGALLLRGLKRRVKEVLRGKQ